MINSLFLAILLSLCSFATFAEQNPSMPSKKQAIQMLLNWHSEMDQLDPSNMEFLHRRQFVDRLIFQIERKGPDPVRDTWIEALLNSELELEKQQAGSLFYDFLEQLIAAYNDVREKDENPISFIKAFTEFSSIIVPKSAEQFSQAHSYINGDKTESADIFDVEDAAESATVRIEIKSLADFQSPELSASYFSTELASVSYLQIPELKLDIDLIETNN